MPRDKMDHPAIDAAGEEVVGQSLVKLTDAPAFSPGAPLPVVLATEDRLVLIYRADDPDPTWDGRTPRSVGPTSENQACAILEFQRYKAYTSGGPNDEALSGHRLYPHGLRHYSVYRVENSEWIVELARVNSVHSKHSDSMFSGLHHFVFTFHDSTLEIVARSFEARLVRGAIQELARDALSDLFRY